MKYQPGPIAGAGSGSVGSLTASRNRFGPYFRTRAIPVNPNTTRQQVIRGYLSQLTSLWVSTVTAPQRTDWETYADNVVMTDVFGAAIHLTGLNHYIRSNVPRLLAGLARVDQGPSIFDLGDYTLPTIALQATGDTVDVSFDNTDPWANEDGSAMLGYASREKAPSINFFKGPYQFFGPILGDAITPPTSPQVMGAPFPFTLGNVGFTRFNVTRADGRLSATFRTRSVCV